MSTQLEILRHQEVNEVIRTLPGPLVDSLEEFEQALRNNEDLSPYTGTKPFSQGDGLGNRTRIEHYHLSPRRPSCYLVWLVRTIDTAYILEISIHPSPKEFTSADREGRLYSRLAELIPELASYRLPGSYRYGFPVQNRDKYGNPSINNAPSFVPVRTRESDYLPLGQLNRLSEGRNRIGVVIGTFEISSDAIPEDEKACIDSEEHPDRESLTLNVGGWVCHSGVYRKETEQIILFFCPLHNVVVQVGTRKEPMIVALSDSDYLRLFHHYKTNYPSWEGNEGELDEVVDNLLEHFPLYIP